MTKAERLARKAGNRARREAAQLLRSLPNPNSNRARRERIRAGAQVLGQAMHGIDEAITQAGGALPGAEVDYWPPNGFYDNQSTQQRERWLDGQIVGAISRLQLESKEGDKALWGNYPDLPTKPATNPALPGTEANPL